MKAIAVYPGKPNSIHLAELPKPALTEVPGGRGVLVRLLRCGVDGTDKEINAAEYGKAPDGFLFLVTGHENFGQVEAVGEHVSELRPGDYVVATVRRPGSSIYDQIGTHDMTTDDVYFETWRESATRLPDRVLRRRSGVHREGSGCAASQRSSCRASQCRGKGHRACV